MALKWQAVSAAVLTASIASVMEAPAAKDRYATPVASGAEGIVLSEKELKELSAKALRGDADAAAAVARHYEVGLADYTASEYWLQIAAENGHPYGQLQYGRYLRAKGDDGSLSRSRFWLRKAAKSGDPFIVRQAVNIDPSLAE